MAQDLTASQFSPAPFPPRGTNWLAKGHTLPPFMKEEMAALQIEGKRENALIFGTRSDEGSLLWAASHHHPQLLILSSGGNGRVS